MLQDVTVFTDNLGASVAQNVTVNNDMVINPANKLTATNIDAVAINNVNNPNGLQILTDQSTITSGSDILVTPNNLCKVYGAIQSDSYQPLTAGGNLNLVTDSTAKVIVGNLQANKITSIANGDLTLWADYNLFLNSVNNINISAAVNANISSDTSVAIDGANFVNIGLVHSTGVTVIGNTGIRFKATGNALLNAYEEDSYTGSFTSMVSSQPSFTFRFVKVGKTVTVSLNNRTVTSGITSTNGATFSQTINSKYCGSDPINLPMMGWGTNFDLVLMSYYKSDRNIGNCLSTRYFKYITLSTLFCQLCCLISILLLY